jgi:hypothetical protein
MMTPHEFGGDWTTEKLQRVRKYLNAYMKIFDRNERARKLFPIYVDAFAGTGYRSPSHSTKEHDFLLPELVEPLRAFYSAFSTINHEIQCIALG